MTTTENSISQTPARTGSQSRRASLTFLVGLALLWLPALFGYPAIQRAAALYRLADSANPYFAPGHAGLLYFWVPVVVLSACILFLTPGMLLAVLLGKTRNTGEWVLKGLGISLVLVSAAAAVVQSFLGAPLRSGEFAFLIAGLSLVCFALLWLSPSSGTRAASLLHQPQAAATLLLMAAAPAGFLIALVPKFFWENFNGDGVHAYEAARLLLFQPLPFWNPAAGNIASFPGLTSMLFVYPVSWFVRLFGEFEASARLPYLLFLVGLFAAMIALIEHERKQPLGMAEKALLWLGLIVYSVAMAYSATYSPYSADIALPATQDTLSMVCFLAFVLADIKRERSWAVFFLALTYLSSPNGMLLIGFWLLAVVVVDRPIPWKRMAGSVLALGALMVLSMLAPRILALLGQPAPGEEYGLLGLLARFAFIQWADWQRIFYAIIPAGILPAFALFAWKRQDATARKLTILTAVYFVFFYFQANISLHYFVPAMLLPMIVFWRSDWGSSQKRQRTVHALAALAGVAALLLALPESFAPYTQARRVGSTIENRIAGYERMSPEAFRSTPLLLHLFPLDWDPSVPDHNLGGAAIVWNYYSRHKEGGAGTVNYWLQPSRDAAPEGSRLVAQEGEAALYLRSEAVWNDQRAIRPPSPAGSPLLAVPRWTLFRTVAQEDGIPAISVVDVLGKLGVDTSSIVARFGGKQ